MTLSQVLQLTDPTINFVLPFLLESSAMLVIISIMIKHSERKQHTYPWLIPLLMIGLMPIPYYFFFAAFPIFQLSFIYIIFLKTKELKKFTNYIVILLFILLGVLTHVMSSVVLTIYLFSFFIYKFAINKFTSRKDLYIVVLPLLVELMMSFIGKGWFGSSLRGLLGQTIPIEIILKKPVSFEYYLSLYRYITVFSVLIISSVLLLKKKLHLIGDVIIPITPLAFFIQPYITWGIPIRIWMLLTPVMLPTLSYVLVCNINKKIYRLLTLVSLVGLLWTGGAYNVISLSTNSLTNSDFYSLYQISLLLYDDRLINMAGDTRLYNILLYRGINPEYVLNYDFRNLFIKEPLLLIVSKTGFLNILDYYGESLYNVLIIKANFLRLNGLIVYDSGKIKLLSSYDDG
jgi:hypothetical protein